MIDLSTAYNEATTNIDRWRVRYPRDVYPHKIVLNMMYRGYTMWWLWLSYEQKLLPSFSSMDEALKGMEQLYGQTAISKIHNNLEQWLDEQPSEKVGNLIFTNYDAKATSAEYSDSILEELEFSYIFDLLQEKLVLYWIALRQTGEGEVSAIAKLTNVVVEIESAPTFSDMKYLFQELIVKQYVHAHYTNECEDAESYDVLDEHVPLLGVNKTKHIQEREQRVINISTKKDNHRVFQDMIDNSEIEYFYHYTARKNLESIKRHGGLFSWEYCQTHGISVPIPGGTDHTHKLDDSFGLLNYVRLSVCKDYPMAYVRKRAGVDIVVLKIKKDVAWAKDTLFSNINAIDQLHIHGSEPAHFKNINIDAALTKYSLLSGWSKEQHDAEIMVKECVPIEYIVNIDNPDEFNL